MRNLRLVAYFTLIASLFLPTLHAETSRAASASGAASIFLSTTEDLAPTDIEVDSGGNTYVTGNSASGVFLIKLDPSLRKIYTIYPLGPTAGTVGDMAIGTSGDVYLVGGTSSQSFPVLNAIQPTLQGESDGFLMRLTPDGTVVYSTYLGGSAAGTASRGDDGIGGVAVDASGAAYVTGTTSSPDFPVTAGALQTTGLRPSVFGIPFQGFVTKIGSAGQSATPAILYSTILGGTQTNCFGGSACIPAVGLDVGYAIKVDSFGNAYVAGFTNTSDFPVTTGAFSSTCNCEFRAPSLFVTKVNPTGSTLLFSTYIPASLGGTNFGYSPSIGGIAVDATGMVTLAGTTFSADFATTSGVLVPAIDPTALGARKSEAFVLKLNATGTALVYSTFLSGQGDETVADVQIDTQGNAYVSGRTEAAQFPISTGALPSGSDFFIELNPSGTGVVYSTRLSNGSAGAAMTRTADGNVYLVGRNGFLQKLAGGKLASPALLGVAGSAALQVSAKIAPGELVSFYGLGIGPSPALTTQIGTDGRVTNKLGDTQVLFNGVAAPLTYVGPNQINAVVPFEVAGLTTIPVEITNNGATVCSLDLQVITTVPAIFRSFGTSNPNTITQPTSFPAAALNQDQSINSETNPAKLGTLVTIFTTGLGKMTGVVNGDIGKVPLPKPTANATVSENTQLNVPPQEIQYFGQAPGLVAGVIQINFRLPSTSSAVGLTQFRLNVDGQVSDSFTIFTMR